MAVSVDVPDDVAAWLDRQPDASAAVTDALRQARRRSSADGYAGFMASLTADERAELDAATQVSEALTMAEVPGRW